MKTTLSLLLILFALVASACGDSEVTAYYNEDHRWIEGDRSAQGSIEETTGPERDGPADSADPNGSTDSAGSADSADQAESDEAWQAGTTSSELLNLEGDVLADVMASGEVVFSSSEPFEVLQITWRGSAENVVLVTDGPRQITPDFAQRGAFDAEVELDRPTSSASIRADVGELTFLRVTAVYGDTQPTDGEDR